MKTLTGKLTQIQASRICAGGVDRRVSLSSIATFSRNGRTFAKKAVNAHRTHLKICLCGLTLLKVRKTLCFDTTDKSGRLCTCRAAQIALSAHNAIDTRPKICVSMFSGVCVAHREKCCCVATWTKSAFCPSVIA